MKHKTWSLLEEVVWKTNSGNIYDGVLSKAALRRNSYPLVPWVRVLEWVKWRNGVRSKYSSLPAPDGRSIVATGFTHTFAILTSLPTLNTKQEQSKTTKPSALQDAFVRYFILEIEEVKYLLLLKVHSRKRNFYVPPGSYNLWIKPQVGDKCFGLLKQI